VPLARIARLLQQRDLARGWKVLASNVDKNFKCCWVIRCDIRKNATIYFKSGSLKTLDKAVVCHSVFAGCSIDALNPELAEITLLIFTIVEGINH